ncbi:MULTISPECIES: c-type cytochrome biogenesis protein CcmI [unclassified Ruegeria]|uniref:c-type cytochrome biogenesis protein CcmI n=1 Tax=unclassified Ruegeria TaxID=2625375 RepID=UPI001AE18100|nr:MULTISPECIES: c-type cytochrome biogenesis protein CcmI [unclassified Ruegeria]
MTFWVLIFLVALLIAAFLSFTLLRKRRGDEPAAAYDLRVYREQLSGVDRDLARGVIGEADAERVRTEISRRILAADEQMKKGGSGAGPSRTVSIVTIPVVMLIITGGAMAMYHRIGAVGLPDMPLTARLELAEEVRANRPSQSAAEELATPPQAAQLDENYASLLKQLRETVSARPDDLQGQMLLAQHETNSGNFKDGYSAQQRVIELSGDAATAEHYADFAEMMILAAGGYVSPEAEQALAEALKRDPHHGPARYYWGQMLVQTGRPDLAYRIWVETLREAPASAPWAGAIRDQIDELAFRAGVFNAPDLSAPSSPSREDMAAAAEMSPEERQQMIQGMVDQLSDRLATEGGAPEEWARLIAALGVLGQGQRAMDIHNEALVVYAGNTEALQIIDAAALQAGIAK